MDDERLDIIGYNKEHGIWENFGEILNLLIVPARVKDSNDFNCQQVYLGAFHSDGKL